MTSKLTREQVIALIAEHSYDSALVDALEYLLAAMDSEPVAWNNGCNKSVPSALRYLAENPRPIGGESSFNTAHLYQLAREIELMAEVPLYRHAQTAPVVSSEVLNRLEHEANHITAWHHMDEHSCKVSRRDLLTLVSACRAAMLQCAENTESRCGIQTAPVLDSLPKNTESRCGNSPVIPDGYVMVPKEPTKEMIDAGWLHFMGTKNPSSKGTYKAMLAAAECSIPMISDTCIPVCERCGDEGWVVGEMGITRCACGQAGNFRENANSSTNNCREIPETSTNSPAIPEGYRLQPISEYEAMCATVNSGEWSQRWIPVSERMPETNKFVLVSNGVWVGQGLYDDSEHLESDEHWQDEHREFINVLHHPVTHWMPLPAAPKQENI